MKLEQTLVLIKPDAMRRGLVGEIIRRLEARGFKMKAVRMLRIDRPTAERHYAEHEGKVFYEPLVRFICSAPVLAMVWEGRRIIATLRLMAGATDSADASPGTIRGDLALSTRYNLIHASDSPVSAAREIAHFFREETLLSYERLEDSLPFVDTDFPEKG